MDFYQRLNYSLGNEDWNVEKQALRVAPGDTVVCVTASGDRPLHLLMTECSKVISIDMNASQNYLLNLKMAAISQLDYDKYLAFLGCEPCSQRLDLFKQIKPYLTADAAHYWEKNKKMLSRGILYQGRTERLMRYFSIFIQLLRRKKVRSLLSFTDIELQRDYVTNQWDSRLWRQSFALALNPKYSRLLLNDPGLNSFVDIAETPDQYIYTRMLAYLKNNLAHKSAFLQLLITGKIQPDAYFPYLTFEGYSKIRRNLNKLEYHTANIIEYLNYQKHDEIDCFSLSDIASYIDQSLFERLLWGIQQAAKPGARFCIREFMSKRYIPSTLKAIFQRNSELEKKLEQEESNFVYRFMVGEINKSDETALLVS